MESYDIEPTDGTPEGPMDLMYVRALDDSEVDALLLVAKENTRRRNQDPVRRAIKIWAKMDPVKRMKLKLKAQRERRLIIQGVDIYPAIA